MRASLRGLDWRGRVAVALMFVVVLVTNYLWFVRWHLPWWLA